MRQALFGALPGLASKGGLKHSRLVSSVSVVVALLVVGWVSAYKVQAFLGLATTSDLFQFAQLSTSWLEGRFLHDNCYGDHLSIHTYFFCPVLAIAVLPFGPMGLLLGLSLATAFNLFGVHRLLRLLDVPDWPALGFAFALTAMPLSLSNYQDEIYGFHVELLIPSMAVWLAYHLLRERWLASLLLAVVMLSIKEDAPLIVALVAGMVGCEKLIGSRGRDMPLRRWQRLNLPALAVLALSIAAFFFFLHVLKSQQMTNDSVGNFQRLRLQPGNGVKDGGSLLLYVARNIGSWLQSPILRQWALLALAGSFGLIVWRPHHWLVGATTTLVAWLMQDDFLWAPRFVQALAFIQIAACLGLASAWREMAGGRFAGGRSWVLAGLLLAVAGWSLGFQLKHVPHTTSVYCMAPRFKHSREDRAKADRLFSHYWELSKENEPVLASGWLMRYARYQNLQWYDHLRGRPAPVWILWDKEAEPLSTLWTALRTDTGSDVRDYKEVAVADRFLLLRRKTAGEVARERESGAIPILGDNHGQIRMKIKIAEGRAGLSEPLLSIGTGDQGDLFFLRYLSEHQLQLGVECKGAKVEVSQPIEYVPGQAYEVELFSGALLPSAENGLEADLRQEQWRLQFKHLRQVRWQGQKLLEALGPAFQATGPDQIRVGVNEIEAASAGKRFLGEIADVVRGGYPEFPGGGMAEYGAVKMFVELPGVASGVPEPLIVTGATGDATLAYIRILDRDHIRVGVEFWGIGAYESEPVAVDPGKAVEIVCSFPVLYPSGGDHRWQDVPESAQQALLGGLKLTVNAVVVLEHDVHAPRPLIRTPVFGKNPAGGSWVTAAFTGRILQVLRLPLRDH